MTGIGAGEGGRRSRWRWWSWGVWALAAVGAAVAWARSSEPAKDTVALWTSVPLAVLAVVLAVVPLVGRREPVRVQLEPVEVRLPPPPESAPARVEVGSPPLRPPAFQPRTRYREQIDATWDVTGTVVLSQQTKVMHGDGGVGKSQLAREYYESSGALVKVWVEASSIDGVITGYAQAARTMARDDVRAAELGVGTAETNQAVLAEAFHRWLRTGTSWLVVLDDLDVEPDALAPWWPSGPGRVLVTTRRDDVGYETFYHPQDVVDLDVYTADEALVYVDERLTPHAADLPDGFTEKAQDLVEALGCHPVALNQAAAVIIDEKLTTGAYLDRFADRTRTLSDLLPQADIAYDRRTVATTWSIALDRATAHSPHAAAMATLVSVAHPTATPRCLFTTEAARRFLAWRVALAPDLRAAGLEAEVRAVATDDLPSVADAKTALHALEHVAVVRIKPDLWDPIAVHALAQRAIGDLTVDRSAAVVTLADAAMEIWPGSNRDLTVGPQLRAVTEHIYAVDRSALVGEEAHDILLRTGRSLADGGLIGEAISFREKLLDHVGRILGATHRSTLEIRFGLIISRGTAGDASGAAQGMEELYDDVLISLGEDHVLALKSLSQLGRWRGNAGKPEEAVKDLEKLLSIELDKLGKDHRQTLITWHNLGVYRRRSGDAEGAVRTLVDVLAAKTAKFGADDPDTLNTQDQLAVSRGMAGDPEGAVAELERVLHARLKQLGADSPATLKTRQHLACWRGEAGDPDRAVAELERVLTAQKKLLSDSHPDILNTRYELARWCGEAGNPESAVRGLEEVLRDQEDYLSENHRDLTATRQALAHWKGRTK